MFNVGGGEIIVILLLALLVLGPDKLPSTAKKVGRFLHEVRRMTSGFEQEVRKAMDFENIDGAGPSSSTSVSDALHRSSSGPQLTGPAKTPSPSSTPTERVAPFVADLSGEAEADERPL
jgi:sec-independent protein translocase protein TatB